MAGFLGKLATEFKSANEINQPDFALGPTKAQDLHI
jgi:hypothetical protein